jgi:putative Mg2+ transporter-C (MgtC) family protein
MDDATILFRFGIAFAGALIFGLARQRMGKPVGFGTFIFLALGSCALSLTAIRLSTENPLPLLNAIVTGVGFLGAGALFRTGDHVAGFTSAATIWVFAVFGLTVGVGEYLVSGILYASIVIVLIIDRWLDAHWIGAHNRRLTLEVAMGTSDETLISLGLPPMTDARSISVDQDAGTISLVYKIDKPASDQHILLQRVVAHDQVRRSSIES